MFGLAGGGHHHGGHHGGGGFRGGWGYGYGGPTYTTIVPYDCLGRCLERGFGREYCKKYCMKVATSQGVGNYVIDSGVDLGLGGVGGTCGLRFPFNRAKREACQAQHVLKVEARTSGGGDAGGGLAPAGVSLPLIVAGGVALVGVIWFLKRRKKAAA
jgi:hypothetical protein